MAQTINLTVPQRSYPIGTTSATKALPNSQQYSHLMLSVDCSGWTDPLTTKVEVKVDWSSDGGNTWENFGSLIQVAPPPWQTKAGPTSIMKGTFNEAIPRDPTHMRGSVIVEGKAVTLGPIQLNAS